MYALSSTPPPILHITLIAFWVINTLNREMQYVVVIYLTPLIFFSWKYEHVYLISRLLVGFWLAWQIVWVCVLISVSVAGSTSLDDLDLFFIKVTVLPEGSNESWIFSVKFWSNRIWNRVDCQHSEKRSRTHKRLKECFLIGWNRRKHANFQGSPLFQAMYNIKTEKKHKIKST